MCSQHFIVQLMHTTLEDIQFYVHGTVHLSNTSYINTNVHLSNTSYINTNVHLSNTSYINTNEMQLMMWNTSMVSFDGGSASKVDDVTALPSRHKMADMCYYGNVMTTTRWWLCVTILHLQQYSNRLNFFFIFIWFL